MSAEAAAKCCHGDPAGAARQAGGGPVLRVRGLSRQCDESPRVGGRRHTPSQTTVTHHWSQHTLEGRTNVHTGVTRMCTLISVRAHRQDVHNYARSRTWLLHDDLVGPDVSLASVTLCHPEARVLSLADRHAP